jgi:hypothetical protein
MKKLKKMAEENREQQLQVAEKEQIDKVRESLLRISNKKSKFLFFVPSAPNPSASVYEIYYHAYVVNQMGFEVRMLTDSVDYEIPDWIEEELTQMTHEPMESARLSVAPEDVMVIPEIFSNVMEQTKNTPCIRVAFLQSIDYMVNGLVPATDWSSFGIKHVITTSQNMKDFVDEFYGKKFDIHVYNVGIPKYFYDDGSPKRPVISVIGRNPNEISKIIKLFYARYPQYGWVSFDSMITESKPPRALRRKEFAERLRKNFASVWVDRIASFGTFPLEAMASGSIPVGIVPDLAPEYLLETDKEGNEQYVENSGVWTNDMYALPLLIGDTLTSFLEDTIGDEVYEKMQSIASNYSQEKSKEQIEGIYGNLLDQRKNLFVKAVEDYEAAQPKEETVEAE